MQKKLRIAAETIEALKKERENMKISVKSFDHKFPTTESSTKETSEEAEELKKILKFKEETIESLENQLRSEKIKKIDLKALIETCEKLKSELTLKEKHIIFQEKIIRDLKSDLLSQSLHTDSDQVLEKLKAQLSDLLKEKNHWKEVFESILTITEESGKAKSFWDKSSNHWKIALETVKQMKTSIIEKDQLIQQLMQKSSKEKLKKLKETNKSLQNELEKSQKKTLKPGFFFDLTEACSIFIQTVHSSQFLYFPFKKHLTNSQTFKEMIEKSEFQEVLLKLLLFFQEIFQSDHFSLQRAEDDSEIQDFYPTPKKHRFQNPEFFEARSRFFSPSHSAQGFHEKGFGGYPRYPGSTQGSPGYSSARNMPRVSRYQEPGHFEVPKQILSNKSQQTSLDTQISRPVDLKSSKLSKEVQTFQVLSNTPESKQDFSVNQKISKSKSTQETSTVPQQSPEGLIKVFDESEQLLSIIDKQNSRLARIGNQISQLVPEKIESIDEPSSESSSNSEIPKERYRYLVTSPEHTEYQEGTFGRKPSSSNPDPSEAWKGRSEQDKYIKVVGWSGNELEVSSVPGFSENSRVEKTNVERGGFLTRKLVGPGFAVDAQLSEELQRFSVQSSPQVPRKHIREGNNENSDSEEQLKETRDLRPGHKTKEYWNSVVDYFSQKDDSN
jgi:hypothetical protein